MADLPSRRRGADRCGGATVRRLCPCQELLIGPVPRSLPGRMGLKCPAYPPVPHRCLPPQPDPAARNTLRGGSGGPARAAATNSTASAQSGSGRICHLRSHHLGSGQRGDDKAWIGLALSPFGLTDDAPDAAPTVQGGPAEVLEAAGRLAGSL